MNDKEMLAWAYRISFIAGVAGGFTVYFFSLIIPNLLTGEYKKFFIGFVIYLLIGILVYLVGYSATVCRVKSK